MSLGKKDISKNISTKTHVSFKVSEKILNSFLELLKNKKSFFYKDILVKIDKKLRRNIRYENKDISNQDLDLLNALKALRLNIAKKNNLPAYTIFHDSSLIQMSQIKPNNQLEMLKIDGVGEAKFKKYGKLFIDKITEYL